MVDQQCWIKRRSVRGLIFLGALTGVLSGCGAPEGVLATVDGKVVLTKESLDQATMDFDRSLHEGRTSLSADQPETARAFARRVADQIVYEALIEADHDLPVDAGAEAIAQEEKATAKVADAEGLKNQLDAYGLSQNVYRKSLEASALARAHEKAYLDMHPSTPTMVQDYVKKKPNHVVLSSFVQMTVPTRAEAEDLVRRLKKDPKRTIREGEQLNQDVFPQTAFARFHEIGADDPRVVDDDLFALQKNEADFYYEEETGDYEVIFIEERKSALDQVADHAKKLLDQERYLAYINDLAVKHGLKYNRKAVDAPSEVLTKQEKDESESSS